MAGITSSVLSNSGRSRSANSIPGLYKTQASHHPPLLAFRAYPLSVRLFVRGEIRLEVRISKIGVLVDHGPVGYFNPSFFDEIEDVGTSFIFHLDRV